MRLNRLALLTALVAGCSSSNGGSPSGSTTDGGGSDAGVHDASVPDAGVPDTGMGGTDSTGPGPDGGVSDSSPLGPPDAEAGPPADAGTSVDNGHSDAATQTSNCFGSPGACGFPDPAYGNVGPSSPCSSLTASGSITVTTAGQKIQNMNVTGQIIVKAANVTIDNVCVSDNGQGNYNNGAAVGFNSTGGVLSNSSVHGSNATNQSLQAAIAGSGTISHSYVYNCGECVHDGPWTVSDSYYQ